MVPEVNGGRLWEGLGSWGPCSLRLPTLVSSVLCLVSLLPVGLCR